MVVRSGTLNLDCTYFDIKTPCSISSCGERPAMRKTGRCAPHSVNPYDPTRENDWMDCYEGCIKHDINARRLYMEQQREANGPTRALTRRSTAEPTKLPTITKLSLLHKHKNGKDTLAKIIREALSTRGITASEMARTIGAKPDRMNERLRGEIPLPFLDVCKILDYLYEFDTKRPETNDRKPR